MLPVSRLMLTMAVAFLAAIMPLQCGDHVSAPQASAVLQYEPRGTGVPIWSNGFFLAHQDNRTPGAKLVVFDRDGRAIRRIPLSFPDAVSIDLGAPPSGGYAVSQKGRIAVTGSAASTDGRGTTFIAIIAPSGSVERVILTWPFSPFQVVFGPDETIWVAGRELGDRTRAPAPHDVLRHYDVNGRMIESMLRSDSFVSLDGRHPATEMCLVATHDRIGVYSVPGNEWVEVSPTGGLLGRWRMPPLNNVDLVTGLAMTRSGSIYLSVQLAHGANPPVALYRLDRAALAWLPVDSRAVERPRPLLGADGDQLVVAMGLPKAAWVTPWRD